MKTACAFAAAFLFSTHALAADPLSYRVSLPDLAAGKHAALSDYKGKVLLIDVVGAKCGFTDREQLALMEMYRELHPQGLEIVSVVADSAPVATAAEIEAFRTRNHIPWKVLRTDELAFDSVFNRGGSLSFPTSMLVTKNGEIRKIGTRRSASANLKTRAAVEKALAEPAVEVVLPDLKAPSVTWKPLEGKDVSSKDLEGTPYVVGFFREGTCLMASALSDELVREWSAKGVKFFGVDVSGDKDGASIRACQAARAFPFPVLRSTTKYETRAWVGINTDFAVVFVDRNGKIRTFTSLPTTRDGVLEKTAFGRALELITSK